MYFLSDIVEPGSIGYHNLKEHFCSNFIIAQKIQEKLKEKYKYETFITKRNGDNFWLTFNEFPQFPTVKDHQHVICKVDNFQVSFLHGVINQAMKKIDEAFHTSYEGVHFLYDRFIVLGLSFAQLKELKDQVNLYL